MPNFDVMYKHIELRSKLVEAKDAEEAKFIVEQMDVEELREGCYFETEEPLIVEVQDAEV